jgi:hypothetical protein
VINQDDEAAQPVEEDVFISVQDEHDFYSKNMNGGSSERGRLLFQKYE